MALTQAAKSRIGKLASFLAAGAVLNVLVAWGCAAALDFEGAAASGAYAPLDNAYHWWVVRWDATAGTRVMSRCWQDSDPGPFTEGRPQELLASWGQIVPPDPQDPETLAQIDEAWGFPFRALACRVESRPAGSQAGMTTTTSKVVHLREPKDAAEPGIYVPVGVVWRGFLLNTTFYGLVTLAVAAAVRDVRGLRRRAVTATVA
jgi:hypothetical protein